MDSSQHWRFPREFFHKLSKSDETPERRPRPATSFSLRPESDLLFPILFWKNPKALSLDSRRRCWRSLGMTVVFMLVLSVLLGESRFEGGLRLSDHVRAVLRFK